MASGDLIFTTTHNDPRLWVPLFVREVGTAAGPCAGSVAAQIDWGYLVDCYLMRGIPIMGYTPQRGWYQEENQLQADIYPHMIHLSRGEGDDRGDYSLGWLPRGNDIEYFMQQYAEVAYSRHIDPDYTPTDGDGQWVEPVLTPSVDYRSHAPRHPRRVDYLRHLFWDIKRMRRWSCSNHVYQRPEDGLWSNQYYPEWHLDGTGKDYYFDPVSNKRSPDALKYIFEEVRTHRQWAMYPAFAIVQLHAYAAGLESRYRHMVKNIDANGVASQSGWTSADCRAFARSCGSGYHGCEARVVAEYYDCVYPHDPELQPWQWEPPSS